MNVETPTGQDTTPLVHRVAFNAASLAVAQVVTAAGGILSVAITTRYLGVGQYGAFITATTLVALVQTIAEFGIGPVGTRELARAPDRRGALLGNIMGLGTALGLAGAIFAVAFSWLAYSGAGAQQIHAAVVILSSQLAFAGMRLGASTAATSTQRAYLSSYATIPTRLITLAAIAVVASADLGFTAMVVAYAATGWLQALIYAFLLRRDLRAMRWPGLQPAIALLRVVVPMGVVVIVNFLYFRVDTMLLSLLGTRDDVALYGVSYKVVEVLFQLPGLILITIMPVLAIEGGRTDRFYSLLRRATQSMQILAFAVVISGVLAPVLLRVIAGPGYEEAATTLRLLLAATGFTFVQLAFGHALVALGEQRLALWVGMVVLAANLAMNVFLIPWLGVVGAAIALVISELLSLVLTYGLFREAGISIVVPSGRTVTAATGFALTLASLDLVLTGIGLGDVISGLIAGVAGLACYAILLDVLGVLPPELRRIARMPSRRHT